MNRFLLAIIYLIPICCYSQIEQTEITGILVTNKKKPIAYTEVFVIIYDKPEGPKFIGTTSDSCGQFMLTVPDSLITNYNLIFNTHNNVHEYPLKNLSLAVNQKFIFMDMSNRYQMKSGCIGNNELKHYKLIRLR